MRRRPEGTATLANNAPNANSNSKKNEDDKEEQTGVYI